MTAREIIRGAIAELETSGWRKGGGHPFALGPCCIVHALCRADPNGWESTGLDAALEIVERAIPPEQKATSSEIGVSGRIMLWNDFHCDDREQATALLQRALEAA